MNTNATEAFFVSITNRGYFPQLEKMNGTVRFDVLEGDHTRHLLVAIRDGHASLSRDAATADCVISISKETLERIASGQANAMAALLRGEMKIEGDPRLAVLIQRLFPEPPRSGDVHMTPEEGGNQHAV